jgi:hypothetical protein
MGLTNRYFKAIHTRKPRPMKTYCRIRINKSFKSIFLFLACAFGLNLNAQQSHLDTLISVKKLVYIEAIIPASVTHGYESKWKKRSK